MRARQGGREHRDYASWIDNDRRLHELLARLEALGAAAFDTGPPLGTPAGRVVVPDLFIRPAHDDV